MTETPRSHWHTRSVCAVTSVTAMAALLSLDGQLGPLSFALRRAIAVTILTLLAASSIAWNGRWPVAKWAGVIAVLILTARAPSMPVALAGYLMALAAIEAGPNATATGLTLPGGLVQTCFTYVGFRFALDLVPRMGSIGQAIAAAGSRYVSRVAGAEAHLSFTALGGPAVVMAVLYLLWSWRRVGRISRPAAAALILICWFAALAVVTPPVSAGPLAAFLRGSVHGVFWLAVAVVGSAILPGRRAFSAVPTSSVRRRFPQAVACLAAALAGVCLVGTAFLGSPAGRSIRVYNRGGLDWERPVYGQFGAFSGGMFGLWPVYCRAEGYDFDVIDKSERRAADGAPKPKANVPDVKRVSPGAKRVAARKPTEVPSKPKAARTDSDGASPSRTTAQSKVGLPAKQGRAEDSRSHVASSARAAGPAKAGTPANDTIEPADLEKTQILVLINSPKVWDDRERRTIYDFVARGGSLLVLGDHTDVFGLMRGFNSLLVPLRNPVPLRLGLSCARELARVPGRRARRRGRELGRREPSGRCRRVAGVIRIGATAPRRPVRFFR